MLRKSFLRSAAMAVGLFALSTTATVVAPHLSFAAAPKLTHQDEIAIRGTVVAWNPLYRTIVIESPERDTLAYRVLPTMGSSGDMLKNVKVGGTVDIRYYRIMDVLVAKTTPEIAAKAHAMLSDPAQAPGILDTNQRVGLWMVQGMVVRTDLPAKKVEIVDPNGGMVYRTPWIKTAAGQAVLSSLQPGDSVTMVFTERTAFQIKPQY